jgi:Amt family ammonium transporter
VGIVATRIFARDAGLVAGRTDTLLLHIAALLFVSAFTFAASWVLYRLTNLVVPLRVCDDKDAVGLDLSQHGESASASYAGQEVSAA